MVFAIVNIECVKSKFNEQHIQPSVNSQIFISSLLKFSFIRFPSKPSFPNSFSTITNCFFVFLTISFIKVVFPEPKNPDIISIFILLQ